jgi:hypothetical protein
MPFHHVLRGSCDRCRAETRGCSPARAPQKGHTYQLKLTPQQQAEVRELTGKDAEALELTAEELEERIQPGAWALN